MTNLTKTLGGLSTEDIIKVIKEVEADSIIAERQTYEIIKVFDNSSKYQSNLR